MVGLNNDNNENKFTIIVGKNGTGKSRVLKAITEAFLDSSIFDSRSEHFRHRSKTQVFAIPYPSNVIAFSTSPFDRFPISKRNRDSYFSGPRQNYQYLGLRGVPNSRNFSQAFLSRIITSLIESVSHSTNPAKVFKVLNDLGFDDHIRIRVRPSFPVTPLIQAVINRDLEAVLLALGPTPSTILPGSIRGELADFAMSNDSELRNAILEFLPSMDKNRLDLSLSGDGLIQMSLPGYGNIRHIVTLLKAGIFRLSDVVFTKTIDGQKISLNEASSGEQSVILGFLGIASYIEDGSLICIDEPEVCLHPEWQEKYIEQLISTFKPYKGCHFVIATHSPQIIANLEAHNCFVLNIETGETADARDLIQKSADFQLASIFGTPGFKNEYLSRELLTLIMQFSSTGKFSNEEKMLVEKLLTLEATIDELDPIKQLMVMLKKAYEVSSD